MDESHKFGRHQGRLKTLLDAPISTSQHALPRSGLARYVFCVAKGFCDIAHRLFIRRYDFRFGSFAPITLIRSTHGKSAARPIAVVN
jgi:hypothetical protein